MAADQPSEECWNECQFIRSKNFDRFCGDSAPACVIGIDEAGRGPVLGPMVYGVAVAPEESLDTLAQLGVTDSKQLTEERRTELFAQFQSVDYEHVAFALRVISPLHLSRVMQQRVKYSLNDESHDSAISLIDHCVRSGVRVHGVFVDTVGLPEAYQAKLEAKFPSLKITVSKKADSLYTVVGAASVCAKVTRDVRVRDWRFPEEAIDSEYRAKLPDGGWGSGYPGDPNTKAFLANNVDYVFGFPSAVRFDWATAKNIIERRCCNVKWEDDGDAATQGTRSLLNFFAKSDSKENKTPMVQRHAFFVERNLKNVTTL